MAKAAEARWRKQSNTRLPIAALSPDPERVIAVPGAARTPYFCSGCPHNTGTRIPDGSVALAGIGCHFLAQRMERNTKTWTHMGAEGVSWVGMSPFTDLKHVFVNLGDVDRFPFVDPPDRRNVRAGLDLLEVVEDGAGRERARREREEVRAEDDGPAPRQVGLAPEHRVVAEGPEGVEERLPHLLEGGRAAVAGQAAGVERPHRRVVVPQAAQGVRDPAGDPGRVLGAPLPEPRLVGVAALSNEFAHR